MLKNPHSFFFCMLLTPALVLPAVASLAKGPAAELATLALRFGGPGYVTWAALMLYIGVNTPWTIFRRWLLLGPFVYWIINFPVVFLSTGGEAAVAFIWAIGALYAIPVAYAFTGTWFMIWFLFQAKTNLQEPA